jgi:hypothetical protein
MMRLNAMESPLLPPPLLPASERKRNCNCDELTSLSGPESNKPLLQINITNVFEPGTGEIANENCSAPIRIRFLQQF